MGRWRPTWTANECEDWWRHHSVKPPSTTWKDTHNILIYVFIYISQYASPECTSQRNFHTAHTDWFKALLVLLKRVGGGNQVTEFWAFVCFLFFMYLLTFRKTCTLHLKQCLAFLLAYMQSFTLFITYLAPKGNWLHTLLNSPVLRWYLPDTLSTFKNVREATE